MDRPARREELEYFKTQINLCDYLASRGYEIDRKKSSRRSIVMRNASGEKLVVSRGANRQWVYFNVHDSRDAGTIIDCVQRRDGGTIADVRKTLRAWSPTGFSPPTNSKPTLPNLADSEPGLAAVRRRWNEARPIEGAHQYLTTERLIPEPVLRDEAFREVLRTDRRGNALFAHTSGDQLCGFEIKNLGFTSFSPGGLKGLSLSAPNDDASETVVCETGIDMLSFAALYGVAGRRFVSTAGRPSAKQQRLLIAAALDMPTHSRIVLAFDNDEAGRAMAAAVTKSLVAGGVDPVAIVSRLPPRDGEDYNDVLRRSAGALRPFATAPMGCSPS